MTEDRLYVTKLEIRDIGGVDELVAELGAVNLVLGDHGMGKTSVLNAIDIVLSGGTDPDLIRAGAEKGVVKLTLSSGVTIEKEITPRGSETIILTPEGGKVRRPAEYLKTLAEGYGFDPIGFLESEPGKRAEFLLKNLPLAFDVAELEEVLEEKLPSLGQRTTLQKVNELRDQKYSERTTLNRAIRDLEGTIQDMRKSLSPDDVADWGAERERLIAEVATREAELGDVRRGFEAETATRKAELKAEYEKNLADLDRACAAAIAKESRAIEEERAHLSLELGTARERADRQQQDVGVRKAIETRQDALKGSISKEMSLSAKIKALDELKTNKLKQLPIEGLDITTDNRGRPIILVDGLPLDRINRQRQLFIAIQAVHLAAGRLPLILCEAAELNDRALEELTSAAKDAKLQLVLARWTQSGPLEIVTE